MKYLLKPELARQFSLTGQGKQKKAFQELEMFKVLFCKMYIIYVLVHITINGITKCHIVILSLQFSQHGGYYI